MRSIYPINNDWLFIKNTNKVPVSVSEVKEGITEEGKKCERISLPHTWNGTDGQDGGNDYFRGCCCYVRSLKKSSLPDGELYFIEICGANSSACIYLNGKYIANHDGGYSTFRANITPYITGEENCLAVLVDNSENNRVYPQIADFTFYGGLYRNVNIIAVPSSHFGLENYGTPGIFVTPEVKEGSAEILIDTEIIGFMPGDTVHCEIKDAEGKTVCMSDSVETNCILKIENVHLWNGIKDPYLYKATATLVRKGEEIDIVSTRFGCRSISVDAERGFILNGKSYPLHGVSRHQDRKDIGNALLPEHHIEDIEIIKEVGANTIRLAHYQHDDYFYDLCDEYGMIVWAEIPYISKHMPTADGNAVSQMKELITQLYNHSSIAFWGISNEITMGGADDQDLIKQHKILNELAHRMDKTRFTVIACLSMCKAEEKYVHIPDLVSYNHYFGWYGGSHDQYGEWFDNFHKKYPETPIGISEYGCEALDWHSSTPEAGDYTEEYQAIYHESLIKQLFNRKYIFATYVWNMFDFGADARAEGGENGQNHKGLVTIDRKYKKDAFYAYKAWLSQEPFVHICGKRYIDRVEDKTKVTVYSNLPEVELFINGESIGKKQTNDHFFYFEVINSGESKITAVAGESRDESVIRKVERFNEKYIFREQGAVLNWFDITSPEGYFSINDKIDHINKTVRGKLWMLKFFSMILKKQKEHKKSGNGKSTMQNFDLNGGVMKMIGGFSVLRFTGMLGMLNISFTKEELLKMNRKLNKIKKT